MFSHTLQTILRRGEKLKTNWRSGLSVALVAMPLSISLAVASGTTPTVGLITAIWSGFFAALFGGSNYNVVGPTGALSGLIVVFIATHGHADLASLTVMTGGMILIAYILRLERYLYVISSHVVHGFTLGVACIIAFNQLDFALGLSGLQKHEHLFWNVVESLQHLAGVSYPALAVFLCTMFVLFFFKKYAPKLPGVLIASLIGILFGYVVARLGVGWGLSTLGSIFGSFPFVLANVTMPSFSAHLVVPAFAIAIVAILETMLSAKIADHLTHTRHSEHREMLGLSLANIASGLAGGIPATAALARTAVNIDSGANSRLSSLLSAIFLAGIGYICFSYFAYIPMAVIAGILVFVSYQMVDRKHLSSTFRHDRTGFLVALSVAVVTFYQDPIWGIMFGVVLSLLIFVEMLSRGQFDIKLNSFRDGIIQSISGESTEKLRDYADIAVYSFKGKLAYLNARAHIDRFERSMSGYPHVVLRLRSVYYIDQDGAEAFNEIVSLLRGRGQDVRVTSVNPHVDEVLRRTSSHYRTLIAEGRVFSKSGQALQSLGAKIDG